MLPSYSYLSRSALSDFTKTVTRKFAMLKKLTYIAYCAVKIHEIFGIFDKKICNYFDFDIFLHNKEKYLYLIVIF